MVRQTSVNSFRRDQASNRDSHVVSFEGDDRRMQQHCETLFYNDLGNINALRSDFGRW